MVRKTAFTRNHRRLRSTALLLSAVTFLAACLYLMAFDGALKDREWQGVAGFTRIVIPDTFVYADLIDEELNPLGFAVAGVKNALGPALLWLVAGSWYGVAALNAAFLAIALLYTARICEHLKLPSRSTRRILLLLGLMPVMTYYSIGALKELPTLAAMTAFLFHYLRSNTWRWLLAALVLFVFRYQTAVVLCAFVLIDRFASNPLRAAVILMASVSACYPLLSGLGILSVETTALFREEAQGSGALVESMRDNAPILSALAVAVRVVQSVLEPIATLFSTGSLFEEEGLSVLALAYVSSLLMVLPSWWRTLQRCVRRFPKRAKATREELLLLALIVLFVVPVGGFSFVHHRYLFPVTALVLIAGMATRRRVVRPHAQTALKVMPERST